MNKFRVGDKVRCKQDIFGIKKGTEAVVTEVKYDSKNGVTMVSIEAQSETDYLSVTHGISIEENFMSCYFEVIKNEKIDEKTTKNETVDINNKKSFKEHIETIMANSDFECDTYFDKVLVISMKTPSGFVITETATCIFADDFDEEKAIDVCMTKIRKKLTELEGYKNYGVNSYDS